MLISKPPRNSVAVFWILYVAFSTFLCLVSSQNETFLVVGERSKLVLSPSLQVEKSPGTKPGTTVLCERVHINGLSRLKNLKKYSHSLKVAVTHSSSGLRRSYVEICFHRNVSRQIGMCPQGKWEKVDKGSWTRVMSPFDHKLLDIRIAGSGIENLELSIEEEFFLYHVIFFIIGIILLSMASFLSKSLVFYYSSAIAIGIILVILVVLFQGMKLLPTGRTNSLAVFIYASLVGLGSFLIGFVPGLLRSLLMELGVSEDMYYPLSVFLLAFLVLVGAWMGFWAVRKLVLVEDGTVDFSTSVFVAWSIRILAVILILQSSLDPLLATGALISGIFVSAILRRIFRWRVIRRSCKNLVKLIKNIEWLSSDVPDLSPFGGSQDSRQRLEDIEFLWPRNRRHTGSPMQGFSRTTPSRLSSPDVYPSTFHRTPEKRNFSKEQWDRFTKESTRNAVQELVSSPDFSRWVASNAERITVTPNSTRNSSQPRRKWLSWF